MKTFKLLPLLIACAMLTLAANTAYCQSLTHTIVFNVNTGTIANPDLSGACNFGQAAGVSNEDYTIEVNVGDIIVWKGVSTNAPGTDEVRITTITYETGANLMGESTLRDSNQTPGIVIGRVNAGNPGDVQKYSITFKVFNSGVRRNGTFTIDPKIQIQN